MLGVGALEYSGLTRILISYNVESLVYCGFMDCEAVLSGNGVIFKVR